MAIEKIKVVDQITATENGTILFREDIRIMEDGFQLAQSYHRSSLAPDSDLTDVPAQVAAIAAVVWTPEVIAAYKAAQAEAV